MVDNQDNIDWNAVFAGIAHQQDDGRGGPPPSTHSHPVRTQSLSQPHHVADLLNHTNTNNHNNNHNNNQGHQRSSSNQHHLPHPLPHLRQHEPTNRENVWENLFPPPILPSSSSSSRDVDAHTPRSLGGSTTTTPIEAGPSRPRTAHRNTLPLPYASSSSAPITPNPTYSGSGGGHDHLFSHLAHSLYLPGPSGSGANSNGQHDDGIPSVPPPGAREDIRPRDLEERLRGRGGGGGNSGGQSRHSFDGTLRDFHNDRDAWTYDPPPQAGGSNVHSHSHSHSQSQSQAPSHSGFPYNPLPSAPTWTTYTSPASLSHPQGAGTSRTVQTPSSTSSTPALPQSAPTPLQVVPDTPGGNADNEDKRQRNTLASAKFRAKRKKHVETVQRRITELETEHSDLTRDVGDLRQENKFLREMVELKYGLDVAPEDIPQAYYPDDRDELDDDRD